MKNRISHISDDNFIQDNFKKLFDSFVNNGYPKNILKKLIYNTNLYDGPTDEDKPTTFIYKRIPLIHSLTHRITPLFKNNAPNLKIAPYNPLTIKNVFSKVKDKTPTLFNSNVVYSLPCSGCNGCYIGQTGQWLRQRVTQHKSDCRTKKNTCAAVEHHINTGHEFDYTEIKILGKENKYKNRLFLEMYYINKTKNTINYKSDINQLSNIYCNILNKI